MKPSFFLHLKKAVALCGATACLLCITACHQTPAAIQTSGFSCDVTAQCGELTVQGVLERPAAEQLSLTIEQPDTLTDLSLVWNGTDLSANWKGISLSLERDTLQDAALIETLIVGLDAALGIAENGTIVGGENTVEGKAGGHRFTLTADPDTGALHTLTFPDLNVSVEFENIVKQ